MSMAASLIKQGDGTLQCISLVSHASTADIGRGQGDLAMRGGRIAVAFTGLALFYVLAIVFWP
jgi:hypothetical protein